MEYSKSCTENSPHILHVNYNVKPQMIVFSSVSDRYHILLYAMAPVAIPTADKTTMPDKALIRDHLVTSAS